MDDFPGRQKNQVKGKIVFREEKIMTRKIPSQVFLEYVVIFVAFVLALLAIEGFLGKVHKGFNSSFESAAEEILW